MAEGLLLEEEQTPVIQSPTPCRIRRRDDVWPPKFSSVRYMPRTGFSPTVTQEGGQGKKFLWPPPKEGSSQSNDVNQLPHGHANQAWNPEANALGNRPPPFAPRTAPTRRCTDDVWPPKGSEYQPFTKSSPRPIKSVGRFEDYIKCRTGPNVPPTYRTPPGTQHIEVTQVEGEFIHQSKTTTVLTTSSAVKTEPVQVARRVEVQEEEEEEEEEYEEVDEEEEEEEEEESEEE